MSSQLRAVAQQMVADGKGILAADESTPTIKSRFQSIGVESTEELRRDYREMLFTADGFGKWISGVILYEETLRQHAADGRPLAQVLTDAGALPGIKVDKGAKALAGFTGETLTLGLDTLRERLAEFYALGARFAKWRAVINVDASRPSRFAIDANARALAHYAALCQEANIVPIVEPEVLMDGNHTLARCQEVTETALNTVFAELAAHRVMLEGIVLKPNMVISATDCPSRAGITEVAQATLDTLKRCVPSAVPGIVFLSGGQSEVEATQHLNEMNRLGGGPWKLSFSYGRALQASALKAWGGSRDNFGLGQKAFAHRARCNSAAALGEYSATMEAEG